MCETKTKTAGGRRLAVLSKQDLDMIAAYKYKPGAYTHLDNLLTPFWNWAVTLLPLWMAPNLVTFIGLVGTCIASLLVTNYSPGLDGEDVPRWCSLLFAVALFLYQTLDAIDGKQARRTNSSSPLGQLFDHGCDAAVKVGDMGGWLGAPFATFSAKYLGGEGYSTACIIRSNLATGVAVSYRSYLIQQYLVLFLIHYMYRCLAPFSSSTDSYSYD